MALKRLAVLTAIAAALTARDDLPAGWQVALSPEGRQKDLAKRAYLFLNETSVVEDDPTESGVLQSNLRVTTSRVEHDFSIHLNGKLSNDLEEFIDFLWVALPALELTDYPNTVLRVTGSETTMRVREENALRKMAVSCTANQIVTTGGDIL